MLTVTLFLLALLVTALGAPTTEDVSNDWRVVGGTNAGPTPYQVSLRSTSNRHFCGGTILNARTIVTAAHCVDDKTASKVLAVVGTTTLNSGGTRYTVSRITIHPDYDYVYFNDVAVVITSFNIVAAANVASIPLSTSTVGAGVSAKLTGWGQTSHPGSIPNDLQALIVKTLSFSECKSRLSSVGNVIESHLCTFTKAGEGACMGDSGGPLVANGQLIGIVSWGYPCARGYPDVFTRVSSFANWIKQNAQK